MYLPTGCWRRNFNPQSLRLRRQRHRACSGGVDESRNDLQSVTMYSGTSRYMGNKSLRRQATFVNHLKPSPPAPLPRGEGRKRGVARGGLIGSNALRRGVGTRASGVGAIVSHSAALEARPTNENIRDCFVAAEGVRRKSSRSLLAMTHCGAARQVTIDPSLALGIAQDLTQPLRGHSVSLKT